MFDVMLDAGDDFQAATYNAMRLGVPRILCEAASLDNNLDELIGWATTADDPEPLVGAQSDPTKERLRHNMTPLPPPYHCTTATESICTWLLGTKQSAWWRADRLIGMYLADGGIAPMWSGSASDSQ